MATRYVTSTGGNWNDPATWTAGIVPGGGDNAVASSLAGPVTVTTDASVYDFDGSGYANTLTVNSGVTLSIQTNLLLGASSSTAGTGTVHLNSGAVTPTISISPNVNFNLKITGTGGTRALGTLNCYGLLSFYGPSFQYTVSGTLNCYGGFYMETNTELMGSPAVNLYGGTWSTNNSRYSRFTSTTTYTFKGNTTIGSYLTIGSGNRVNYDAGTITTTGSTITFVGTADMTCGEVNWNNVNYDSFGGSTVTWYETPNIYGMLTFVSQTNNLRGATMNCYGGVTNLSATPPTNGNIYIKGGTWNGTMSCNVYLDGNSTFGTTLSCTATLTYVSGTITTTNSNYQIIAGSNPVIDVNGNVTFNTITNSSTTFTIPEDITCNNYVVTSGSTTNINNGLTLTINTAITGNGTPISTTTIKETVGTGTAYIDYLGTTLNCNLKWISFTDIDASGGKLLIDFLGTLDTTSNIYSVDWTDISAPKVTTLEI